jgi:hypothetical protein
MALQSLLPLVIISLPSSSAMEEKWMKKRIFEFDIDRSSGSSAHTGPSEHPD